jgi:hypothetical protein
MISTKQVLVVMNDETATTETFRNFGWKLAERRETPKNDRGTLAADWTYVDPTTGALLDRRLGSGFIILKFERDDQDSLADPRLEKLFADYCERRDAINQEGKKKVEVDHRDVGIGGFKAGVIIGPILIGLGAMMTGVGFGNYNASVGSAGLFLLITGLLVFIIFLSVGVSYRGRQVDQRQNDSDACQGRINTLARDLKEITDKIRSIGTDDAESYSVPPSVSFATDAQPSCQSKPAARDDAITQLREYKKLLDEGVITQEEFEKKKHDILG